MVCAMKRHPLDNSLWFETAAPAPETAPLEGARRAGVAVIGAGYTGLSTALHLARAGVETVVVEAEQAGYGGSGRNAGHCAPTFLHHTPEEVIEDLGPVFGPRMVRLQADAANLVFGLIRDYGIDCEAAQNGIINPAHTPSAMETVRARHDQYAALGKPVELWDAAKTAEMTGSERYFGAWYHPEGGHLNPLGYARGLARAAMAEGAAVHTGSPVLRIVPEGSGWRVETERGSVAAERVVVATNAYSGDFWPKLDTPFFRMTAFNVATAPLGDNRRGMILPGGQNCIDSRGDTQYMKLDPAGRLVTGSVVNWSRGREAARSFAHFDRRLAYLFPELGSVEWRWFWHGHIAMMPNMLPRLYELAPGVAAALGFSGRGVPTGTAMGVELAKWARGTDPGELALPLKPLESLATRRILTFAAPTVLGPYYRWQDRRSMRRDGLVPPRV
jgi:glycine/D-amino acid oxidase-like deaminating enzyme